MGEVWRGVHRDQQMPVALKLLDVKLSANSAYRSAFRREVRAMAGLDHANIIMVFDHGEVSEEAALASLGRLVAGTPYLALELVEDGSLSSRVGRLNWPTTRAVLMDLLLALSHAHARGVIHRDIKPGNVLVSERTAKLTDFGLAHAMHPEEGQGRVTRGGTPQYMAPEQFQGRWRDFGPWTDLYALGCLAWTVTTGRPPFPGKSWAKVMHAQLTKRPPPFRTHVTVPRGFESWLRRLLRKDQRARFQCAADALWALDQLDDVVLEPYEADFPDPLTTEELSERSTLLHVGGDAPTTAIMNAIKPQADLAASLELLDETEEGPPVEVPPLPAAWVQPSPRRNIRLVGAGLGVYGLRSIPLVGREKERDLLWRELRRVRQYHTPRLVTLVGPMGCGKSRLAEWACERAFEVGSAHVMKAVHSTTPGPVHGLARMVERWFRCVGMPREELIDTLIRELSDVGITNPLEAEALCEFLRPGGSGARYGSPQERYASLTRILRGISKDRPIVLWADDVQWGYDLLEFTWALLHARRPPQVLLVFTARDTALAERPAESTVLDRILSHPASSKVWIDALPAEDSSQLIRELLFLEGELADAVQERVVGNPLFAVQLVGDMVQRGLLEATDGGFRLKEGVSLDLPDDLHGVWTAATERVLADDPAAQRTLALGAALGLEIDAKEWCSLCTLDGAPPPESITERLADARLLRRVEGGFTLVHGMLRESLIRSAREDGSWSDLNRACAKMLRTGGKARTTRSGRLGRHLLESGDLDEAIDHLLTGATQHRDKSEFRQAVELLDAHEGALDTLELPANDLRRLKGWLGRSSVMAARGRPLEADKWAQRVEEALHGDAKTRLSAAVFHHRARALRQQDQLDDAESYYLAALKQYRERDNGRRVGDCLHGLGRLYEQRGHYDRANDALEKARAAYEQADRGVDLAHCTNSLALVAQRTGDMDAAEQLQLAALEQFQTVGHRSGIANSLRGLGRIERFRGEYDEARRYTKQALVLFEELGDPFGQQSCINGMAEVDRYVGKLEEAERGYREALALAESIGAGEQGLMRINLALVVLQQGRYVEARPMLNDVITFFHDVGKRQLEGGAHISAMAAALGNDDIVAFKRHFRAGQILIDETGIADPDIAWPAELAGRLAQKAGLTAWARACFELAMFQYLELKMRDEVDRIKALIQTDLSSPQ
jgi:eukaryotic-like serine/threonine-protein kinase